MFSLEIRLNILIIGVDSVLYFTLSLKANVLILHLHDISEQAMMREKNYIYFLSVHIS